MTHDDILDRLQAVIDAEAATPSPVRRRTVTEIVPGKYGVVRISGDSPVMIVTMNGIGLVPRLAPELRAAAATLVALADALDEMAGDSK